MKNKSKTHKEATDLADGYFLTHGSYDQQRNQSSDKPHTADISTGSDMSQQPMNSTQSIQPNSEMAAPSCNYCQKRGHLRSECF